MSITRTISEKIPAIKIPSAVYAAVGAGDYAVEVVRGQGSRAVCRSTNQVGDGYAGLAERGQRPRTATGKKASAAAKQNATTAKASTTKARNNASTAATRAGTAAKNASTAASKTATAVRDNAAAAASDAAADASRAVDNAAEKTVDHE